MFITQEFMFDEMINYPLVDKLSDSIISYAFNQLL